MILLTLQNVNKSFGINTILKDVSLTLQAGSRMGLVGVNGSGKSTLFRLISGAMEPDSGVISLAKGMRVGVLTQDADIRSDLTIQQEMCIRDRRMPACRSGMRRAVGRESARATPSS